MSTKTKQPAFTSETQGKHFEVDIIRIRPLQRAGGNIRSDYGDLTELAISIFHNGIIMPMRGYRVSDDKKFDFETFDGHRRLAAGELLVKGFEHDGIKYKADFVRAKIIIVREDRYSDEQIILDMITTNSGKTLTPVEQAEAIRRLGALGWKPVDIAARFGKTVRFVENLKLLAGAPLRIREIVSNGIISYTLVGDIFKRATDYNAAISEIEAALGVAKLEKKIPTSKNDVEDIETKGDDLSGVRVTKKHLDKAINRVDSNIELKRVFKAHLDSPKSIANEELFTFAKNLAENKLTKTQGNYIRVNTK